MNYMRSKNAHKQLAKTSSDVLITLIHPGLLKIRSNTKSGTHWLFSLLAITYPELDEIIFSKTNTITLRREAPEAVLWH